MATKNVDFLRFLRSQITTDAKKGGLKCYRRPNRKEPRTFNAQAAARAVCAAVKAGVSPSEIRAQMARCVPCAEGRRSQAQQQVAVNALNASQTTLLIADGALNAFQLVARWVGRVARFVPQARVAGLALGAVEGRLGLVRTEIAATRAANDVALTILRRAA